MATFEETRAYVEKQLQVSDTRTKNAVIERATGARRPRRSAILKLEQTLRSFKNGQDTRWIALLGLRGVGKTTMLSQLFQGIRCAPQHKVFFAMDDARDNLNIGVKEILNAYEHILGKPFEELTEPVYIFIDEIHFDPNWPQTLKPFVDRSPYIFIAMTGSSVAEIRKNLDTDTARRVLLETLHPMSFTEYMLLKYRKTMGDSGSNGVGQQIRQLIYEGADLDTIYEGLVALRPKVMSYWRGVPEGRKEIDTYMRYANLPFTVAYGANEEHIYQQINQILSTIINKDLPATSSFEDTTIKKIRSVLYALANSSEVNVSALARDHEIDRAVLTTVLDSLEKASVLQRIYPYAQHGSQTTKPSKYLFVSSAYRSMFFNFIGSVIPFEQYKGYLLEDVIALYLSILTRQGLSVWSGGISVTYDPADNGADFIISNDQRRLCIEVGYGTKKPKQANATSLRHNCSYGITVSSSPLGKSSHSITLPLSYFLLTA